MSGLWIHSNICSDGISVKQPSLHIGTPPPSPIAISKHQPLSKLNRVFPVGATRPDLSSYVRMTYDIYVALKVCSELSN